MGRESDKGGGNPKVDCDREAKAAARAREGEETTDATDVNGERGEGEKKWRQEPDYIMMNNDH